MAPLAVGPGGKSGNSLRLARCGAATSGGAAATTTTGVGVADAVWEGGSLPLVGLVAAAFLAVGAALAAEGACFLGVATAVFLASAAFFSALALCGAVFWVAAGAAFLGDGEVLATGLAGATVFLAGVFLAMALLGAGALALLGAGALALTGVFLAGGALTAVFLALGVGFLAALAGAVGGEALPFLEGLALFDAVGVVLLTFLAPVGG